MEDIKLYIVLISVHGLVKGSDIELGKDPDTGGQIKYVIELAKSLIKDDRVSRVDVLTRLVDDHKVDDEYKEPIEELGNGAYIVRLPCGPRRYLRKEVLWPYLDSFTDRAIYYIRNRRQVPDIIHSHYADAGYVASRLAGLLELPHIHTGHSLGRSKKASLLAQNIKKTYIEKQYNITRRIEAEEMTLDSASLIIASTEQEIKEQYSLYDHYELKRMLVIPPGVDLSKFSPLKNRSSSSSSLANNSIEDDIDKFLFDKKKPCILAISRPDPKKNVETLIHAYGKSKELQSLANLVIILGNREDIETLDKLSKNVITKLLFLIDFYDLYGKVAYPKQHKGKDVPEMYRIAAKRRGVFINPALNEPFGLTLIEAAASGLPIIATKDGGPKEIIKRCRNGLLVDPLNVSEITALIKEALTNKEQWSKWRSNGIRGVNRHFSWGAHTKKYIEKASKLVLNMKKLKYGSRTSNLIKADKVLICDIDNTLLGNKEGLAKLIEKINEHKETISFGVATGRSLESAIAVLKEWNIPTPNILITSVGSEIHYGPKIIEDAGFEKHINYRWKPSLIKEHLKGLKGLIMQGDEGQRSHKISYFIDPKKAMSPRAIAAHLRRHNIQVKVIFSHDQYLDILPIRASKGLAVRYFAMKWNIPFENILVAGDSGNDEEMLRGNTLGVVVGNYSRELDKLRGDPYIYFASGEYSWGIIEGIDHFNFF